MKISLAEQEAIYVMRWKQLPNARTVLPPMPWKRAGYVEATPKPATVRKRIARKKYTPRIAEDTAPPSIRRLRTAYCDHFIKTGVLDEGMTVQLRKYADDCRTARSHSRRVSNEQKAHRYVREDTRDGDHGGGDAMQIDGAAAARIADFLRS